MAGKQGGPSWSDIKTKLAEFDRAGLLSLVQDFYATSKDNQAFVHARLQLSGEVFKHYKATIDRWLWPDVFKNQDTSVVKAKKAVADYKKASSMTEGLVELTVFSSSRVSARDARRLGTALISHTCARTRQLKLASYERLFPNQDTMSKGGFCNGAIARWDISWAPNSMATKATWLTL